ncbi:MAG: Hpt domain-containing protein [Alphaproteobacteria bacterium]|nr:Hpt domain-containing protein [Alphaproteobacteria bacterium]MDX5369536.1 Hpt domain-containing protein [Alphaproteobacteria bacterium]MDX5464194.1 Hpt domain-containing protein [Alphaproteobacteria bacterium]
MVQGTGESAQGAVAAEANVIDEAHLMHYTLGDQALACEILELFVAQVDIYLDQLGNAGDDLAWHEAAHSLKGSARAIGAQALSAQAAAAETVRYEDEDVRARHLEVLAASVDDVKRAAAGYLRRVRAA